MSTLDSFLGEARVYVTKASPPITAKGEMDKCLLQLSHWFRIYEVLLYDRKGECDEIRESFGRMLMAQFHAIYALGFTVQECLELAEKKEVGMEKD